MGKLLKVNLTTGETAVEDITAIQERFLGGRGVGAYLLLRETSTETSALDPEAPIILSTGLFAGTSFIGAGRSFIETKNYNTEGVNFSAIGGFIGSELKFTGYDAILIKGKAKHPVYLHLHGQDIEIRNAAHLWGTDTWTAQDIIRYELDDEDIPVLGIGQAGERLLHQSALITNYTRCATSGGIGAIWGAKNLKALAVRGSADIEPALNGSPAFANVTKRLNEKLGNAATFQAMGKIGCLLAPIDIQNDNDMYPFRGTQGNHYDDVAESNLAPSKFATAPECCHECYGCAMKCGQRIFVADKGPFKGTRVNAPENNLFYSGTRLDVSEPSNLIKAYEMCSRYGLDGDQVLVTIAWAFELYQHGIITQDDTDGLDLTWGNDLASLALIRKIVDQDGFGKLLSLGTEEASKVVGKGSEYYSTANKHQDNLDDGRAVKGWALGNYISLRGGKHLDGAPFSEVFEGTEEEAVRLFESPTAFDQLEYAGKGKLVHFQQRFKAIVDSLGVCYFGTTWMDLEHLNQYDLAEALSAAIGREVSADEMLSIGERIINVEKAFNTIHAGFTREDDQPPRVYTEKGSITGNHRNEVLDKDKFNEMLTEYYRQYQWDEETSWPKPERLREIGLPDVADKLEEALASAASSGEAA